MGFCDMNQAPGFNCVFSPLVVLLQVFLVVCGSVLSSIVVGAQEPVDRPTGIFGNDDRISVDSTVWPWSAIGLLQRKVGWACTATLVTENAVLTAAHCLFNRRSSRQLAPAEVRFLAGYR